MILILTSIIIINSSVIVYLWKANKKAKALHFQKTEVLESIIVGLLKNHEYKNEKLQLAEELKEQLRASKNKLNTDILSLQYEFIDVLSRNKLIK